MPETTTAADNRSDTSSPSNSEVDRWGMAVTSWYNDDGEGKGPDDDHCYQSMDASDVAITDEIWLGDTGTSSYMTISFRGMYKLRDSSATVTVGNGEKLRVQKVGDKVGTVLQKDETKKNIVLRNVKFVPDLNCNLLSLAQAIQSGFHMTGSNNVCHLTITSRADPGNSLG